MAGIFDDDGRTEIDARLASTGGNWIPENLGKGGPANHC
jgi:hypothetical protein